MEPFGPSWGLLGPCWDKVGASWGQVGTSWATWVQFGANLRQLGTKLGPSWGQVGPSWSQVGAKLGQAGTSWGQVGTMLADFSRKLAITTQGWRHMSPKIMKDRPQEPNIAFKAWIWHPKFIIVLRYCRLPKYSKNNPNMESKINTKLSIPWSRQKTPIEVHLGQIL